MEWEGVRKVTRLEREEKRTCFWKCEEFSHWSVFQFLSINVSHVLKERTLYS